MPTLSFKSPSFLLVYNQCLLKITNENVVEGMCKVVGKHANNDIGLHFGRRVMCIFMLIMSLHFYVFLLLIMFACLKACK